MAADNLTGNFDVVAEFSTGAVNRVLAAMHRCERFPHSLAIRVDDNPPAGSKVNKPSIVASVDTLGIATADHSLLGLVVPLSGQSAAAARISSVLDPLVNPDLGGIYDPPVVPSHLQGRAQLQLTPPTIELSDASGKNLTVKIGLMARYFPDPHTSPLAEFMRGELQLTAGVDQVVSQQLNMIDVNIKADQINVNFKQAYPPQPLSAEDLAAVNLLIRNALKTSFLPSSNPVPGNIDYVQFKALVGSPGQPNAIAVMLNLASFENGRHIIPEEGPGDPVSLNNDFLGAGDDFALGVGRDFILASFAPLINGIRTQQFAPIPVSQWPLGTGHYTITIGQVTPDLTADSPSGKLILTIAGSAVGDKWWTPNFSFTAKLTFTLQANGDTVDLVAEDISDSDVNTTSGLVNALAKGNIVTGVRNARDAALKQKDASGQDAYAKVNNLLSADHNLGRFLRSLLKPPDQQPGVPPPQDVFFLLWYNLAEIQAAGIVLHGSLAVADWPAAHVEFEKIPANPHGAGGLAGGGGGVIPRGPDFSALNSWIPGGAIERYEWSNQGEAQPFETEDNKFVLISGPPSALAGMTATRVASGLRPPGVSVGPATTGLVSAYSSLCLTVRGSRLASAGAEIAQPVSASACGVTTVPVVQGVEAPQDGKRLMAVLTRPSASGLVEVAGHVAVQRDSTGGNAPNRLVHFADDKTASSLGFLLDALRESKRSDAATAVVAVLTPDQLARASYIAGVIYAEEQAGEWAQAFGVKTSRRPLTLIAGPKGGVVWQQEGKLDAGKLASVLARYLARTGHVTQGILGLRLRIGRPAPNFLLELVSGHSATLRKLAGQPITMVFWRNSSKASVQAVLDLQKPGSEAGAQGPLLLAINDGDDPILAKKVAAENGLTATIVPDPQRDISLAYGVNIWPTIVLLDASGLVEGIRFGRAATQPVSPASGGKPAVPGE